MKHTRGFTLVELMITVVMIGILSAIAIPNMANMRLRAREAVVRENCHTVRLAAEDFSVTNLGLYAMDLTDTNPGGDSIVDLLPGGGPLENPFTRAASEPVDGQAAVPGQSGYQPILNGSGTPIGYTITGFGHSSEVSRMIAGI